jgi:fatty acid desaturase
MEISNTSDLLDIIKKNNGGLKAFQTKKYYTILAIICLYLFILACFTALWIIRDINAYSVSLIKAFLFIAIGWAQYSIGNGMHEAIHKNFPFKNDYLCGIIAAYPIGLTMSYRNIHLDHHRYVGSKNDPDFHYYEKFPSSKIDLLARLIYNASGIPAAAQFLKLQTKNNNKGSRYEIFVFLAVQGAILLLITTAFKSPLYYFLYWVLPVATVGKFLSSTRLMCEHSSAEGWVIRTITGSRIKTWVLGAFDFNYHAEHHEVPSIPFAHLAEIHSLNMANIGSLKNSSRVVYFDGGYIKLLYKFFQSLPWLSNKTIL